MKIIPFSVYIKESPIAVQGDWEPRDKNVSNDPMYISKIVTEKYWNIILGTIKTRVGIFELRKHKVNNSFIVGEFQETVEQGEVVQKFRQVFFLVGERNHKLEHALSTVGNYKKLINVNSVYVDVEYRGKGIAYTVYRELVNKHGFVMMGDQYQFHGARKLWAKLSKDSDVLIDIIDLNTKTIIKRNTLLKQGHDENDFDEEIWSSYPNADKNEIRPILRKML